jgi:V/A-type H+-transporting ATPase subunit I
MTLRSQQTHWFEVFLRRDQVVYALEALAGTHSVQLELDPRFSGSLDITELDRQVRQFDQLVDSHRSLLPDSTHKSTRFTGPPEALVERMLRRLRRWLERLEPLLLESETLKEQRDQLKILQEAAIAMGESASQLPLLAHTTDLLFKRFFRCASGQIASTAFEGHLEQKFHGENHCFVVIACLPGQCDNVVQLLIRAGCEEVVIPADLAQQPGRQLADILQRLDSTNADLEHAEEQIRVLREDPQIAEALANIETLRWFTGSAHQVGIKDADFCRITGWTSEIDPGRLQAVLNRAHVEAELRFARPPAGVKQPVESASSWWRQPFQIFTAMSGAPSADEIDPTGLLAIVVPLLFGYMFPDTGHGLIIAIAGMVLSRYTSRARFLISCGLVSALMGFVFDDFFGYQMLNQPWQIHALDNPLLVLVIPMFFGMGLLLLGLIFNGVELYWRGELRRWLLSDAAVLILYINLLLSLLYVQALLAVAVALVWYIAGAIAIGGRHWAHQAAIAIGELAHSTLTLMLNTISFVRVGAFALAHGGLSMVVVTLTETVETPLLSALLFILGQALIIALEGLVVFVQTTRLVLFEFFTQFLRAEGRFFKPLSSSKPPQDR